MMYSVRRYGSADVPSYLIRHRNDVARAGTLTPHVSDSCTFRLYFLSLKTSLLVSMEGG